MEETRLFIIDLDPTAKLGRDLRDFLELNLNSCLSIREQSLRDPEGDGFFTELSANVAGFNPCVVFLVSAGRSPRLAGRVIESLDGRPVLAVCGELEAGETVELLKRGLSDFVAAPLRTADLLPRVRRFLEQANPTETTIRSLRERMGLRQFVGKSPPFLAQLERIPQVAGCDVSVLISGETGTGKELFARAIHYLSPRAGKPFVPVSCGAIPHDLVENELFGHVPGAFTGATSSRSGLIGEAACGTLFLDEIDCLPFSSQVKFLRFLQEKEYRQLGSSRLCQTNVRVISATNLDLEKAMREGKFRRDLYYRLNIIPLALPPLRERKEDIPLLLRHFAEKHAAECNERAKTFTADAIRELMSHAWPGNVRELENVAKRSVILAKKDVVDRADVLLSGSKDGAEPASFKAAKARAIEQFEKQYIKDLLLAYEGNISRAAGAVRKNRRALWELIRKHGIDASRYRTLAQDPDNQPHK